MEILGRPWTEDLLLNLASQISELELIRRMPPFANASVEPKVYESVPVIPPNSGNVPAAYPLGVSEAISS
jgi:hypothetical protein